MISSPLFANIMAAETHDAKFTRGDRKVLPRTDGTWIVYDARRPFGDRTESVHERLDEAERALGVSP